MRLECKRTYSLIKYEPDDCIIRWTVDVRAAVEDPVAGEAEEFTVGRFLADELRRFEIGEWGFDVWDAADADSSGLEAAWAAVLDENGEFREDDFESVGDPLVYLYRFELHPDFSAWRLAIMDSFCRIFDDNAIVLAQYHTTWLSDTEFSVIGFRQLPVTRFPAPAGYPHINRETRFMFRENSIGIAFGVSDYPEDAPAGAQFHEDWLQTKGPWRGLC